MCRLCRSRSSESVRLSVTDRRHCRLSCRLRSARPASSAIGSMGGEPESLVGATDWATSPFDVDGPLASPRVRGPGVRRRGAPCRAPLAAFLRSVGAACASDAAFALWALVLRAGERRLIGFSSGAWSSWMLETALFAETGVPRCPGWSRQVAPGAAQPRLRHACWEQASRSSIQTGAWSLAFVRPRSRGPRPRREALARARGSGTSRGNSVRVSTGSASRARIATPFQCGLVRCRDSPFWRLASARKQYFRAGERGGSGNLNRGAEW